MSRLAAFAIAAFLQPVFQLAAAAQIHSIQPAEARTRPESNVTIPSGTPIAVRTSDTINAANANDNRTYAAQLDQDVVDPNGNIVIPRGAGEKRSAEYVGGETVLGVLLGAISGDGAGAALGALTGGAMGAHTRTVISGPQILVPAESVLHFRLDRPISMNQSR